MKIKIELDESQLDIILESIQIGLRTYQFITHNSKYATDKELSRISLITLTYEKIFNVKNQLISTKKEKLQKNNKKIS